MPDQDATANSHILKVGNVDVSFAEHITPAQRDLLIKYGRIRYEPLAKQIEAINHAFGYDVCTYRIEGLRSRNKDPIRGESDRVNIREVSAHLETPLGGRDIGTSSGIELVFAVINKTTRPNEFLSNAHFLLFRKPTFGRPDTHSLFPVAGGIRLNDRRNEYVLFFVDAVNDLLRQHDISPSSSFRLATLPAYPSVKASQFEMVRTSIVLLPNLDGDDFDSLSDQAQKLQFEDTRTLSLIPADTVIDEIGAGRVSGEILTAVQATVGYINQQLRYDWGALAQNLTGSKKRTQANPTVPNWVQRFEDLCYKPR